jgi:GntR family transcriptional regulator of arabinose operon
MDMGIEAAKWIVSAVEKKEVPQSKVYEPELVVRNSTMELKKTSLI